MFNSKNVGFFSLDSSSLASSVFRKILSIFLALSVFSPQTGLAFITNLDSDKAIEFLQGRSFDYSAPSVANSAISLGEFLKVLLSEQSLKYESVVYKFDDVPLEGEQFVNKALQLGLINYNPENPVLGFNSEISLGRALNIAFKYYGFTTPKYLLDREKFEKEVLNFNADFFDAPLIERGILLGVLTPQNGNIRYFAPITRSEVSRLVYHMQKIRTEFFAAGYDWGQVQPLEIRGGERETGGIVGANFFSEEESQILEDVFNRIASEYLEKDNLNKTELFYGTVMGLVKGLGDKYSVFEKPTEAKSLFNQLDNQVEGIGASLTIDNLNRLTVVTPLANSPAQRAGLKANDVITEVDGIPTYNFDLQQAVQLIQGVPGTSVVLTVLRSGQTLKLTVVREKITVPSVTADITGDNIGVLRVSNIGLNTDDVIADYVEQMSKARVKGVVLDLRNNPGGYLETVRNITEHFLNKGDVITRIQYANGKLQEYKASKTGVLSKAPVVVLVNEGTASSAEILAVALREHRGAKIVGSPSFGKGTVQELITYTNDSALKLSVARWFTPKGVSVNNVGIVPDMTVYNSENDERLNNDAILNQGLFLLR